MARSLLARSDRGARRTRCTAATCSGTSSTDSARDRTRHQRALRRRARRRRVASSRSSTTVVVPDADVALAGLCRHASSPATSSSPTREAADDFDGPDYWDVAAIIYTSGTTGPSKGVLMPWGTLWSFVTTAPDDFVAPGRGLLRDVPGVPRVGEGDAVPGGDFRARMVIREQFSIQHFWSDVRELRHHRRRARRPDGAVPDACSPSSPTTPTHRSAT